MLFIYFYCLFNAGALLAVSLFDFYPFGPEYGDHTVPRGDDSSSNETALRTTFQFFNQRHWKLIVNINGDISFGRFFSRYNPKKVPFDSGNSIIAVYMADLITNIDGYIFYRKSTDKAILKSVSSDIRAFFDGQSLFNATWSFIVTWDRVPSQKDKTKLNTFQCVLVSNGKQSFVINLYHRLDMPLAKIGFDDGYGKHFTPTNDTSDIVIQSNVQVPGKFIYRVDQDEIIGGNVDECRGKTCYHGGICKDIPGLYSWKCICKPGFTGFQCETVNILPITGMSVACVALLSVLGFAVWFRRHLSGKHYSGKFNQTKTTPLPVQHGNPNEWLGVETPTHMKHQPTPVQHGYSIAWLDDGNMDRSKCLIYTTAQPEHPPTWVNGEIIKHMNSRPPPVLSRNQNA